MSATRDRTAHDADVVIPRRCGAPWMVSLPAPRLPPARAAPVFAAPPPASAR